MLVFDTGKLAEDIGWDGECPPCDLCGSEKTPRNGRDVLTLAEAVAAVWATVRLLDGTVARVAVMESDLVAGSFEELLCAEEVSVSVRICGSC